MLSLKTEIKEIGKAGSELNAIREALKILEQTDVLVGIPEEKNGGHGSMTNAELAYIHNNGSPINGVPAREILVPAINQHKEELGNLLKEAHQAATEGKDPTAALQKAGMQAQNFAQKRFEDNDWEPNKPETIARWVSKKRGRVSEGGGKKPLIDTSALRKSMTYVLRKKGSK